MRDILPDWRGGDEIAFSKLSHNFPGHAKRMRAHAKRIAAHPCPCESGRPYGDCHIGKGYPEES